MSLAISLISCDPKTAKEFAEETAEKNCDCRLEQLKLERQAEEDTYNDILEGRLTNYRAYNDSLLNRKRRVPGLKDCMGSSSFDDFKKDMLQYTSDADIKTITNYLELSKEICDDKCKKEFPQDTALIRKVNQYVATIPNWNK
jgi:hypothetical protein